MAKRHTKYQLSLIKGMNKTILKTHSLEIGMNKILYTYIYIHSLLNGMNKISRNPKH